MFSLLNVSNGSSKSEEFSLNDIEVLVHKKEQNWFKRAHVRKFLGLTKILMSVDWLDTQEMTQRDDIKAMVGNSYPWPGPKDQHNKTDKFLSVYGVMYVIVNSRKDKGKAFKEHILKDIVPRGFDARIEEIQEKHRQAIEEKDEALALLNDDLQNGEYENVTLQAQRDVYQTQLQRCQDTIIHLRARYVDHARDPGKDNIIIIVWKHTAKNKYHDLPYYVARIH